MQVFGDGGEEYLGESEGVEEWLSNIIGQHSSLIGLALPGLHLRLFDIVESAFANLRHLNLDRNRFASVPQDLRFLTGLTHLSMENQFEILDFTDEFGPADGLQIVHNISGWATCMVHLETLSLRQQSRFMWSTDSLFALAALQSAFLAASALRGGRTPVIHWDCTD